MSTSQWNLDPVHSGAEFKVKHMMISNVKGQFTGLTGALTLDDDVTKSSAQAKIEAATINTRDPQRDAHLKSAEFFDVENYPTLEFHTTKIRNVGDGELEATGTLTIHGVSREVTFAVEG